TCERRRGDCGYEVVLDDTRAGRSAPGPGARDGRDRPAAGSPDPALPAPPPAPGRGRPPPVPGAAALPESEGSGGRLHDDRGGRLRAVVGLRPDAVGLRPADRALQRGLE